AGAARGGGPPPGAGGRPRGGLGARPAASLPPRVLSGTDRKASPRKPTLAMAPPEPAPPTVLPLAPPTARLPTNVLSLMSKVPASFMIAPPRPLRALGDVGLAFPPTA